MPSTHGEGKPYGRAVASQSLAESIICPSPCLHERQGLELSHRPSYGSELLESEDRCTLAIVCPRPSSCRLARMWGGGHGWRRHSPSPSCHSQSLPPSSGGLCSSPEAEGRKRGTGRVMPPGQPGTALHLKPASARGLLLTRSSFAVTRLCP